MSVPNIVATTLEVGLPLAATATVIGVGYIKCRPLYLQLKTEWLQLKEQVAAMMLAAATSTSHTTEPLKEEVEAAYSTPVALVVADVQSPLSKASFLLAVQLYAEARGRYDALTAKTQAGLLALKPEEVEEVLRYRGGGGAGAYGVEQVYMKWPDVSPEEFIHAYDSSYMRGFKDTLNAIVAATVGQYS